MLFRIVTCGKGIKKKRQNVQHDHFPNFTEYFESSKPFPSYRRFLTPQCFPLLVIGYSFNYGDFLFFDRICSKSFAAELSYEGKG